MIIENNYNRCKYCIKLKEAVSKVRQPILWNYSNIYLL
jgi:hypothetical protein